MEKTRTAILGTGNIGSDLLRKAMRSKYIECAIFAGRNENSTGVIAAKELGVKATVTGEAALKEHLDEFDIIFDATSAPAHEAHLPLLKSLKKPIIDLTPSEDKDFANKMMCIPAINLRQCHDGSLKNGEASEIGLISCGGQANIPLILAMQKHVPGINYIECVSAISSKSAGPATRMSIDQYVQKTSDAIKFFTKISGTKVILNLNPANPPINMHNTIYAEVNEKPDMAAIEKDVLEMVGKIRGYVPGFSLKLKPIYADGIVTMVNEVIGMGDYLPPHAGNLDIMTCAAIAVAESFNPSFSNK